MSAIVQRQTAAINFHELYATGHRLRGRIIRIVLGLLALTIVIALLVSPKYIARSELMVLPSDEYTYHPAAGSTSLANEALPQEAVMGSEIAILRSPAVARSVIKTIGLKTLYPALARKPDLIERCIAVVHAFLSPTPSHGKPDPIAAAIPVFESHLGTMVGTNDNVITVTFSHRKPVIAERTLFAIEAAYLAQRRAIYTDEQSKAVAVEAARERTTLDQAAAALSTFQAAHNVTQFQTRETILLNQQGVMEQNLMKTNSSIAELIARLATLRREHRTVQTQIPLQQSTNIDQRTAALRSSLDGLRSKLDTMSSNYRANSPEMRNLRRQINAQTATLRQDLRNRSLSSSVTGINPVYSEINLDLTRNAAALAAARSSVGQDQAALSRINAELRKLDALKVQLADLDRRKDIASRNYAATMTVLSDRRLVEQVNAEKRANVRVLSLPNLPINPYPLRRLILLAGMILCVVCSVAIVVLANFFRAGRLSGKAFELNTGIPLLAVIPELRGDQAARLHRTSRDAISNQGGQTRK